MIHASVKPGLWESPDCDLHVLSHVPGELAFGVVAATFSKQRDELARNVVTAGGAASDADLVLRAMPDLSSVAARIRRPGPDRRPRGRALTRLSWALRRARVFLESFAPPIQADDPVLEDRAFDLLAKVVFLQDILDSWLDPKAAAAAAARKTG